MSSYNSDRRGLLKIIGAIGATCAYPYAGDELFGQTAHQHTPVASVPAAATPRFFGEKDYAMISRIADLIIPRTDTPGAVDAGVPEYIDLLIGRNADYQMLVAEGLRWLDGEAERIGKKSFLALSEEEQFGILEPLSRWMDSGEACPRNVEFFRVIKALTADGYYTSKVGLVDELGYRGNTARTSFPDCIHEH